MVDPQMFVPLFRFPIINLRVLAVQSYSMFAFKAGSAANVRYPGAGEGPARSVTGAEPMTTDAVFTAQETHRRPTADQY